jgi:hypothetical protein
MPSAPASDSDEEVAPRRPQLVPDDNEGLHPLFWDALPSGADEDPAFAALKALDDELTPEERAESHKVAK